jgi:3-oxoadipate enol-lactonase
MPRRLGETCCNRSQFLEGAFAMKSLILVTLILPLLLGTAPTQKNPTPQDAIGRRMQRAILEGVELDYEVRGKGEPVVLAHAGVCADWFKPLMEEPALAERYRLVRYHRVGYAGSSRLTGAVSLAQQAAHLRSLLRHLGIRRAHIVGHSSSGNIALQLALDAPEMVQSLAILEPALMTVPSASKSRAFVVTALQLYRAGDKAGAIDTFMRGVCGDAYRAVLDQRLPSAFDQAVADADTFFGQELPAVQQWSFTQDDARRISQPVLAVIGEKSPQVSQIWVERQQLLLSWLPKAEPFVLSGATHLLNLQNSRRMAESLSAFFARHRISAK